MQAVEKTNNIHCNWKLLSTNMAGSERRWRGVPQWRKNWRWRRTKRRARGGGPWESEAREREPEGDGRDRSGSIQGFGSQEEEATRSSSQFPPPTSPPTPSNSVHSFWESERDFRRFREDKEPGSAKLSSLSKPFRTPRTGWLSASPLVISYLTHRFALWSLYFVRWVKPWMNIILHILF